MRLSVPDAIALGVLAVLTVLPFGIGAYPVRVAPVIFMWAALAGSWNLMAGYAGAVDLGPVVYYGIGAFVTAAFMIKAGLPFVVSAGLAGLVAVAIAFAIGTPTLRLRGAYFAIGTLALGEILRTTVNNVLPEISTLPTATIGGYKLAHRYYLALGLAAVSVLAVAALGASRLGLGMRAIREDEEAAEATGVNALSLKLWALALSTGLAALAGGVFAYYHISYYPAHPFSPHWTFDALLITYIGGVGTLHGPVLGAIVYVLLKEYLAERWVDFHLLIFGVLFIAIVLLLPGGLVQAASRIRRLLSR